MPHYHSLQEQKALMRVEMRARRAEFHEKNPNKSRMLADLFLAHVKLEKGMVVASYNAFRDEMDPSDLIDNLRARGQDIALPVVAGKGKPLAFRLARPGTAMIAHPMGFLEPGPEAEPVDPDLVLVPLLAFDRRRHRLGYGGGFYDRTLAALRRRKPVIAVGIAYAAQEVDQVPIGLNDIALDKIITEVNVF